MLVIKNSYIMAYYFAGPRIQAAEICCKQLFFVNYHMAQQPSNPDSDVLLTALDLEPSATPLESLSSDSFLNAKSAPSLALQDSVSVDLFGAGRGEGGAASTTFSDTRDMEEMDLSHTHNDVDIIYFPSSNSLCLGFIGAAQT
eukprot:15327300-Ditylum_brightwellii.AAC.1